MFLNFLSLQNNYKNRTVRTKLQLGLRVATYPGMYMVTSEMKDT